ncbi:hypothetical protein CR155_19860 [Pollutimonas nitritireducens]|uniref:Uncharacterized protein n=1 Tax=Pollutimonas nitritireducens TaxID=2045209 RepID=A0A2N4UAM6_9BURK|nr:hypothetical protein CR155_19860 [Pollutimonas nitritireducens]
MIDERLLSLMAHRARVVNIARGELPAARDTPETMDDIGIHGR